MLVAITALAALALATAGGVAAAPGGQGKGKGKAGAKGYKVSRGATTLTLDSGTVGVLTGAGIELSVNKPATLIADPLGVKFPVTQGRVKVTKDTAGDITAARGKISHSGGVTFTEGEATITLRNLRIVLDDAPDLTALVVVNGESQGRLSVADLGVDLSKVGIETVGTKKHPRRWLNVDDVTVTLNDAAEGVLSSTFGLGLDPAAVEIVLGTADVHTRIVGRFPA